jgi:hypothetical protein
MGKTVGMVAEELEKKYGILEAFVTMEENFIVDNFEKAYVNAIDTRAPADTWTAVWDPIQLESKFRHAITGQKFDGIIKGVPTKAAQEGVSHLRADPYRKGATARPSFMNTGLYMRSLKAWLEK